MSSSPVLGIKIGGSVLDDENRLRDLCNDISLLHKQCPIVIIHGGSTAIKKVLDIHRLEASFKDGLRITSAAAMDVVEMALCGIVNTRLVRALNAAGLPAVGMTGADAKLLCAEQYSHEHKRTGKIHAVNSQVITHALSGNYLPVISPTGVDSGGKAMNINADWAASSIAAALKVSALVYVSDQDGILDEKGNTIPKLSRNMLTKLIAENIVSGGMLAKAKSVIHALDAGITPVYIVNGKRSSILPPLLERQGENSTEDSTSAGEQGKQTVDMYKHHITHISESI